LSHIVTVKTEVRDPAVAVACRRLGLPEPVRDTATLISGRASGLLVRLPGLTCTVTCDTATGTLHCANYGRAWGRQEQLDRLLQAYAMERPAGAATGSSSRPWPMVRSNRSSRSEV
jgi:hypothetical protein